MRQQNKKCYKCWHFWPNLECCLPRCLPRVWNDQLDHRNNCRLMCLALQDCVETNCIEYIYCLRYRRRSLRILDDPPPIHRRHKLRHPRFCQFVTVVWWQFVWWYHCCPILHAVCLRCISTKQNFSLWNQCCWICSNCHWFVKYY